MFDALRQVLLLSDRTRAVEQRLGRYRRPCVTTAVVYGVFVALVGTGEHLTADLLGWWPLLFALTVAPLTLMIRSPVVAWRWATLALVVAQSLIAGAGRNYAPTRVLFLPAWQWGAYVPVLLVFALVYSARMVLVATMITAATVLLLVPLTPTPSESLDQAVPSVGLVILVALVGYAFGSRGRAERRAEQERAERAALAERARIAREMHDVVAHHMSMVAVRCETAAYRIAVLPEAGVREFSEVGAAARAAITDMQALLGVLRSADQPADRAPQPGLAQIPELVRGSPEPVELDLPEIDVPDAVALTAYRIVQEAITNASRHAPGCRILVRLRREDGTLEIRVRNTHGGPSRGSGGGHGLVGMRERVALHGGTFSATSTVEGGFEVLATVPLGEK